MEASKTQAFDYLISLKHKDPTDEEIDKAIAASFFEFRKYPTNIHLNEEEVGVAYTDCPICGSPSFSAAGFCLGCGFAAADNLMTDEEIQTQALEPEPTTKDDYKWTRWNFFQILNQSIQSGQTDK